jgi:membrane-bound lytic murein transglycosylase MltF
VKKPILLTVILLLFSFSLKGLELTPLSVAPYKADLETMQKKGVIRVLVSADLGFYYIENGRPKGVGAELLYHFEKMVKKNNRFLNVQVIPVPRDDLLPALSKGYGDLVVANLTITRKRQEIVDFSTPLLSDIQELLITNSAHPPITDIKQLSGKEVWVRGSSSYFESLQLINQQLTRQEIEPIYVRFIEETLQDFELIEMINQGYIETTVLDSHKAKFWIKTMDNIQINEHLPLRTEGEIAWAMRKDSPNFKKLVNQYVRTARSGTLLGNVIYQKYLDKTNWYGRAINPNNVKRLESLVGLFKKYADMYEFDFLMISAQAFQESGLDQRKVSHKGAVGIMQVLPTTASDPNVNIKQINEVENNIHAGVKYLKFIKDRYFDSEDIEEDDQIYFALAAYNAGPAKIRRMRKIAAQKGYDPDVWFKNVEIVARQHISSEPVKYVANINRYYVIYKQLQALNIVREEQQARNSQVEFYQIFETE